MFFSKNQQVVIQKKIIHFIPNLKNGGAENFLLRLVPYLDGQNFIVTYLDDSSTMNKLNHIKSVKHISLFKNKRSLFSLLQLLWSLNSSDRVYSWLHVSDLLESLPDGQFR